MTLAELITTYRKEVGDNAKPYFLSDEELTTLINDAEEEACIRSRLIFERADAGMCEIDVAVGDAVYETDPRVTEITRATASDGTEYAIIDMRAGHKFPVCGDTPALIQYDTTVEIVPVPTEDDTISIECYRTPARKMDDVDDEPEISHLHHKYLLDWVKHRVYAMQDADIYNAKTALQYEARFERHFGKHPGAKIRKPQNANRPHTNRVW